MGEVPLIGGARGCRGPGSDFSIPDPRSRVSNFVFWISGFGFRVSGSRCSILSFGSGIMRLPGTGSVEVDSFPLLLELNKAPLLL